MALTQTSSSSALFLEVAYSMHLSRACVAMWRRNVLSASQGCGSEGMAGVNVWEARFIEDARQGTVPLDQCAKIEGRHRKQVQEAPKYFLPTGPHTYCHSWVSWSSCTVCSRVAMLGLEPTSDFCDTGHPTAMSRDLHSVVVQPARNLKHG